LQSQQLVFLFYPGSSTSLGSPEDAPPLSNEFSPSGFLRFFPSARLNSLLKIPPSLKVRQHSSESPSTVMPSSRGPPHEPAFPTVFSQLSVRRRQLLPAPIPSHLWNPFFRPGAVPFPPIKVSTFLFILFHNVPPELRGTGSTLSRPPPVTFVIPAPGDKDDSPDQFLSGKLFSLPWAGSLS